LRAQIFYTLEEVNPKQADALPKMSPTVMSTILGQAKRMKELTIRR
jgi:hypothetical protein